MVHRAVRRALLLEHLVAYVINGLIVDAGYHVGIRQELLKCQCRVIRLERAIRHLGRRDDRESGHYPIRILLLDLVDQ